MIHIPSRRGLAVGMAAALTLAFLAFMIAVHGQESAVAGHQPANKVAANGSTVEVVSPGEVVTLLDTSLRTSPPTDLMISVTAECSITTTLRTVGNDEAGAEGVVEVWVEIDGDPVGVNQVATSTTSAESLDDGEIVFCNQANQRETSQFDDQDATIDTFLRTKQANGFNWVALNVGGGIKEVEVKARLTETATNNATAEAAVGNRTLIVEPTKLPNDAGV